MDTVEQQEVVEGDNIIAEEVTSMDEQLMGAQELMKSQSSSTFKALMTGFGSILKDLRKEERRLR